MMKTLPRGIYPFWFWNGLEEEDELRRQLELMHRAGCHGAAIHSRNGNRVEFLSPRYLELVRAAAEYAAGLDFKLWIYDEDNYPSGNAGGEVQRRHPELTQQYWHFEYSSTSQDAPADAAFIPGSVARLDERRAAPGTPALRFFRRENPLHVDTLRPETAKCFIELVHERFYAEVGEFFGRTITAFFTDDVSHQMYMTRGITASPELERVWRERYGGEITDILPCLVEELPGCREIRRRYHELAQELFLANFIMPQRQWCADHGVFYLGHLCCDEGPAAKAITRFGSPAPFFVLEDIPSIDDYCLAMPDGGYLRRLRTRRGMAPLTLYAAASSAARQFKGGHLCSEVLTSLGWNCPVEYQELQIGLQLMFGVDLLVPHAFYYTIGGKARRDAPPSYFFQQPYFALASARFNRWTELAKKLHAGVYQAPVLLVRSAGLFAELDGNAINPDFSLEVPPPEPGFAAYEECFDRAVFELCRRHVNFDIGDEFLLDRAELTAAGTLRLGAMEYSAIVRPELAPPLKSGTRELLKRFAEAGGQIITPQDAVPALELCGDGAEEVLSHTRHLDSGVLVHFVLNLSGRDLALSLREAMAVCEPESGQVESAGCLFVLPRNALKMLIPAAPDALELKEVRFLHDNLLRLENFSGDTRQMPPGTAVHKIYLEHAAEFQIPEAQTACEPHPADHSLTGRYLNCDGGKCSLTCDRPIPELWLAGSFEVDAEGQLRTPGRPGLGDLARQGYPWYWGAVEYVFAAALPGAALEYSMNGAAELLVDGRRIGLLTQASGVFRFPEPTAKEFTLRLWNTAANLLTGTSEPFGLNMAHLIPELR